MPVSKKTRDSTRSQKKTGSSPAAKPVKTVKNSGHSPAQKQLRSFQQRFNPESNTQLRGDSNGSDEQNTSRLINALAAAKPPVLKDETSLIEEDASKVEKTRTPAFLSDQYFYYRENQPVGCSIARISLDREVEIESCKFTNTGINISDDGYYQIDKAGEISLTLLGVLSQANDCNEGTNRIQHNITLIDTSGNCCSADVIFNIVDEKRKPGKNDPGSIQQTKATGATAEHTGKKVSDGNLSGNVLRKGIESTKRKSKNLKKGDKEYQHILQFPLFEFSRDKNRTRDESLILGLEQETSDRFDQLNIVSVIRDRSLSVEFSIKHVVTPANIKGHFILTRLDGGALPGWLRVNEKEGKLSGIVPGGLNSITVRAEFKSTGKISIIRFITIDLVSGEIQELQSRESGTAAGLPMFTEQLQANAQASSLNSMIQSNEIKSQ